MATLERWKAQKKALKLTNQAIADTANLPLRTVEQVMCGKVKNPRNDTVQAIERALGLSPTFTQEERALGLSEQHLIAMSDRDRHRFHVLAFADEILGVDFVDTQINLLEIAANAKANAKNKK